MLSPEAYRILSDPNLISAPRTQQALQLAYEFDLSLPRSVIPEELDKRFDWGLGTCRKLLSHLCQIGILQDLRRETRPGKDQTWMIVLAPAATFTPRALADAWDRQRVAAQREEFARQVNE